MDCFQCKPIVRLGVKNVYICGYRQLTFQRTPSECEQGFLYTPADFLPNEIAKKGQEQEKLCFVIIQIETSNSGKSDKNFVQHLLCKTSLSNL